MMREWKEDVMKRFVATWTAAVLILGMLSCSSAPSEKAAAPGDCCKKTAELKAQMPKCCASGEGDCCKAAKADPSKKAECCKKADEISAQMPECCKKAAAGEAQACCSK
jgi:hypothetical protein